MTKPKPVGSERRRIKLTQLAPFFLQPLFYTPASHEEEERLAADLRDHGQRDPIVVVPIKGKPARFTILDGHRRVAAFEALGGQDIEATIRWDLADADESTVEAEFLQYNLNRRHLHQIERARIALRQFQIEKGRPRGQVRPRDEHEARNRVGKAIGMSGRNLSRYFRLLLTPVEIQNAVRDGKLALVLGERSSWLPQEQQMEIAKRITAGEDPKAVVADYIETGHSRHRKASAAFRALVKHLETAVDDLEGRTDQIYRKEIHGTLPLLAKAGELLARLRREGKKPYVDAAAVAASFKDMAPRPNDAGQTVLRQFQGAPTSGESGCGKPC
ncbi:MAG: ParB N-terminal domain-containing protein [Candidatus Anammoximicrobium sp.]|nr:ParB N-terminal domain-containing protein [Candidatus Anammoximicrobium sp.]